MNCCSSTTWDQTFTRRFAHSLRRRYERRGLSPPARRMVDLITARGIEGASVLEIGGGVGDIQVELLRRGAARAMNLELAATYESDALALLNHYGMQDRATRLRLDVVSDPESVEPADIVILHRVVCCYPDYAGLLTAAAAHSRRLVAFSHPPDTTLVRLGHSMVNGWQRMLGRDYRAYLHPPEEMRHVVEEAGFRQTELDRSAFWSTRIFERAPVPAAPAQELPLV